MDETILKMESIHTFIGQYHILQGISLEASADAVTVILGRNGGGKSTTLRTIMGLSPPSKGRVFYKGKEIHRNKPYEIARLGVSFVPEDRAIFSGLTVEENMRVAMLQEGDATVKRCQKIFEMFPDLQRFWTAKAGILSGGQKQMLAIARAIVNQTNLLLIDEPTKGLAPIIIKSLIDAINQIKEKSAVIMVEQNFSMAEGVGDYFYILDSGVVVRDGLMDELIHDEGLKNRYLGISKREDE